MHRALGQVWTPDWTADILVRHALVLDVKEIFDPAVGDGSLYRAAKRCRPNIALHGYEIDESLAAKYGATCADYVLAPPNRQWDAIVANPPYIRHHKIPSPVKKILQARVQRDFGFHLDGRAGLHVYFLTTALASLAPHGRCAFILPADIAEGAFAEPLWRSITSRFRLERIITFDSANSPFPDCDINPIIVVISNEPPSEIVEWEINCGSFGSTQFRQLFELLETGLSRPPRPDFGITHPLGDYARVIRGVATGANDFFLFTSDKIKACGIPLENFVRTICRVRDCQRPDLTVEHLDQLDRQGRPTYLLSLKHDAGSASAYILEGEKSSVHKRALLSTRSPWYKMETRNPPPPILFSYLGRTSNRFILNQAGAVPLSTFLCVYPKEGVDARSLWERLNKPETIGALSCIGKSYGGNACKVEPRMLEKLPVAE